MTDQDITIENIEPKMELTGVVKKIDLMGAVLDVAGHPALLHVSQVVHGRKVGVEDVKNVLNEGEEVTVYVMEVDQNSGKLLVTMLKPPAIEWEDLEVGKVLDGTVVRLKKYGAFIDIGAERPGLVHVSELSNDYVEHPKDAVKRGDEVKVKVIGLDRNKNQIDLSIKALDENATPTFEDIPADDDREEIPTAMAIAMQRALAESGDGLGDDSSKRKSAKKKRAELDNLLRSTLERHNSNN